MRPEAPLLATVARLGGARIFETVVIYLSRHRGWGWRAIWFLALTGPA
jgi:hypothetical protein